MGKGYPSPSVDAVQQVVQPIMYVNLCLAQETTTELVAGAHKGTLHYCSEEASSSRIEHV